MSGAQGKPWWASRTIWFNVALVMSAIGAEFAALADLLPQEWQEPVRLALVAMSAIGNMLLRVMTAQPIRGGR